MSERIDSEAVERRRARLTRIFADIIQHAQVQCLSRRRARLTRIFADIIEHAQVQCLSRCPYRDSRDLCTAQFGCRNQGPVDSQNGLSSCLCDGEVDYRGAWGGEEPAGRLHRRRAPRDKMKTHFDLEPWCVWGRVGRRCSRWLTPTM